MHKSLTSHREYKYILSSNRDNLICNFALSTFKKNVNNWLVYWHWHRYYNDSCIIRSNRFNQDERITHSLHRVFINTGGFVIVHNSWTSLIVHMKLKLFGASLTGIAFFFNIGRTLSLLIVETSLVPMLYCITECHPI